MIGFVALLGAYATTGQIIYKCILMTSSNKTLPNFWKEAEQINGRLAMMGFFALIVNYGLTGWIIPGYFKQ